MALASDYQNTRGTALATFTQTGTYSTPVDLGGGWLVGVYSDNFPSAAGSLTFRSSWAPVGSGWPVQTCDGYPLRVLAFGSGTFYSLGHASWNTAPMQYVTIQIGTAGTAGVAAGGTIVLITSI